MSKQFERSAIHRQTDVTEENVTENVTENKDHLSILRAIVQGDWLKLSRVHGAGKQPSEPAWMAGERGEGEMVLVVDDDVAIRRLVVRMLSALGYRTLEAEDGPTALRVLDGQVGVELMLTDIILPKGMNGVELGEKAMRRAPELAVLSMSGYTREALSSRGIRQGRLPLLLKPFGRQELARAVRLALSEQEEQLRAS
jgi:CheY-like chemotaxis protein